MPARPLLWPPPAQGPPGPSLQVSDLAVAQTPGRWRYLDGELGPGPSSLPVAGGSGAQTRTQNVATADRHLSSFPGGTQLFQPSAAFSAV